MAVLETIRVKFGILITVLIAVALLSFIIDPSTLQSVSYMDFQADVDKFTAINEIVSGSSVQNEQQQIQVRNAAWQSLVDKYLFVKNAKKAGLNVGEEEMLAIISGEMDSPVFTQNPAFCDENGNFSPEMIASISSSPTLRPAFFAFLTKRYLSTSDCHAAFLTWICCCSF